MHVPDWTRQFERFRLGPRNDWNIRSILKAREKPALHHSIQSPFGKRFHEEISRPHFSTNLPESARSSRISRIPPNLPDPVESPGFPRIHSIRRIRRTRAHGFINIEPPFPTAHYSREPQPGSASVIECLCGLIRVRGVLSAWAQSPFYDCSVVVLCPPVDLLVYGHRPF